MTSTIGVEFFSSCIPIVDRLTSNPSTVCCQILNQNILLTTISTTDSFLDYVDFVFRYLTNPAYYSSHVVWNLSRCVNNKSSAFNCCITDMRLQWSMLNLTCLICFFNNGIGFSKAFLYISDSTLVGCSQVSSDICMEWELVNYFSLSLVIMSLVVFIKVLWSTSPIFNLSVMDEWSTFSHCLFYSKHCIQWLILYFNK